MCPVDLDTKRLQEEIASVYARLATDPKGDFHFHRGPDYAVEFLGYDRAQLAELPAEVTASFAGVANPLSIRKVLPWETVLDIGSGAGTDLLLAAQRTSVLGRAIGVERSPEMIDKCLAGAAEANLDSVDVANADLHELPLENESVHVIVSNGVLNLAHDKVTAFREIVRVLKPGGHLQLGDIAVEMPLSEEMRKNVELWAGCIGGALPEAELIQAFRDLGLTNVSIVRRFDCFKGTSKEVMSRKFGVRGVNLYARKPSHADQA